MLSLDSSVLTQSYARLKDRRGFERTFRGVELGQRPSEGVPDAGTGRLAKRAATRVVASARPPGWCHGSFRPCRS